MKEPKDPNMKLLLLAQESRSIVPSPNQSFYPAHITSILLRCFLPLAILYLVANLTSSFNWSAFNVFNKQDATSGPIGETIIIPLDHFNSSDLRTFQNHYWMNDAFYERGGPIFFYDAGEAGLSDRGAKLALGDPDVRFAPVELAKKYHGIAIMWEHRFYGDSMPFSVSNLSGAALDGPEAYKYLTNEQALEDAVYFAKNFNPPGYNVFEMEAMRADRRPWVWIGGSYPGVRAAMIRVRNPDIFFASWASSAPVQAQIENSVYFNVVQQSMPRNCSADVHAAITYADEILVGGTKEEVELVKKAIWLANSAIPWNISFAEIPSELSLWNVSQILSYPFQSSPRHFQSFGYERSLGGFCNDIDTWNSTPFTGTSNLSFLITNDLSHYPTSSVSAASTASKHTFYAYLQALVQKSISDFRGNLNQPFSRADSVSWRWQLCSQDAKFQVSQYPSPHNIISRFNNVSNHLEWFCRGIFPYTPAMPDVDAILKYGGWKMRPSNVMFTNGELDPWRALGVQSDRQINPDALERKSTQTVPKCGEPPEGDEVFGAVWEGEVHVRDLRTGKESFEGSPVERGLELFGKALDQWLPCFGKDEIESGIVSTE